MIKAELTTNNEVRKCSACGRAIPPDYRSARIAAINMERQDGSPTVRSMMISP